MESTKPKPLDWCMRACFPIDSYKPTILDQLEIDFILKTHLIKCAPGLKTNTVRDKLVGNLLCSRSSQHKILIIRDHKQITICNKILCGKDDCFSIAWILLLQSLMLVSNSRAKSSEARYEDCIWFEGRFERSYIPRWRRFFILWHEVFLILNV